MPLVASPGEDGIAGIAGARLWRVMRRFFTRAADVIQADHPMTAEKLRRARALTGYGIVTRAGPGCRIDDSAR